MKYKASVWILLAVVLLAGCLSVNLRRPQTPEELRFSVDFTRTVAHGLGYYWSWQRLEGHRETSATAGAVLEAGHSLARAAVVLSSTESVGTDAFDRTKYQWLTTEDYTVLREAIREFALLGNAPDREMVMDAAEWWLRTAQFNLSDRAHLAAFCTEAAKGIRFGYTDRFEIELE